MLETAPSLSIYTKKETVERVEDKENKEESSSLIRSVTIGDKIDDFTFINPQNNHLDLINEEESKDDLLGEIQPPSSPPMYLGLGLGLGVGPGFGLENGFREVREEEEEDSDEYFRQLLEEYPNHPLVLKYYAQFLKKKGDLEGAEEYYYRAAKADPSNGEVVSEYALLVWELHRDQERASTYFELAAQSAPKDSTVLAAYAKFLWEIDDEGDESAIHLAHPQQEHLEKPDRLHPNKGNPNEVVGVDDVSNGVDLKDRGDIESYLRKMVEENSSDPLYLKKYAQFLFESKGDLQGAEEFYERAILANPNDGEMLLQYATLLWELYHDKKRTLSYLERAIEAAPEDSNILAAYARFLWTLDDDEF